MRKVIFLAITCFLLVPALAVAQVPQTMSYQGMLRDDATQGPISDGDYSITFRLYAAPSGGSAIWSETGPTRNHRDALLAVCPSGVSTRPRSRMVTPRSGIALASQKP